MDPTWLRILLVLVAGVLARPAPPVALYAGGAKPELEGETVDADGRPSVRLLRDRRTDSRGR